MEDDQIYEIILHPTAYSTEEVNLVKEIPNDEMTAILKRLSLKYKWMSEKDSKSIISKCPFCKHLEFITGDSINDNLHCSGCLCPPNICSNHGVGGYFSALKDLPCWTIQGLKNTQPQVYDHMLSLFK